MNQKDIHTLVDSLAEILTLLGDSDQSNSNGGFWLSHSLYWLTPTQTSKLARIIDEHYEKYFSGFNPYSELTAKLRNAFENA